MVDLTGSGVLQVVEINTVWRIHGRVIIKIIVGSQEETNHIPKGCSIGYVFSMWNMEKTSIDPGNQIL